MRIFYVEDDEKMQKFIAYSLIKMGHEVVTVDNGKEAYKTLDKESFDFIILDIFLPGHSGIDIARHIREELRLKTPVIILSRSHDENLIQQAMEAGVNEYLTKPIEPDILLLILKKHTGIASG
jgi:DNA-binding response OmpR family regulator